MASYAYKTTSSLKARYKKTHFSDGGRNMPRDRRVEDIWAYHVLRWRHSAARNNSYSTLDGARVTSSDWQSSIHNRHLTETTYSQGLLITVWSQSSWGWTSLERGVSCPSYTDSCWVGKRISKWKEYFWNLKNVWISSIMFKCCIEKKCHTFSYQEMYKCLSAYTFQLANWTHQAKYPITSWTIILLSFVGRSSVLSCHPPLKKRPPPSFLSVVFLSLLSLSIEGLPIFF